MSNDIYWVQFEDYLLLHFYFNDSKHFETSTPKMIPIWKCSKFTSFPLFHTCENVCEFYIIFLTNILLCVLILLTNPKLMLWHNSIMIFYSL